MALLGRCSILGSFAACLLFSAGLRPCTAQEGPVQLAAALPDAPQPQHAPALTTVNTCDLHNAAATMAATAAVRAQTIIEAEGTPVTQPPRIVGVTLCVPHMPIINWYARFLSGSQVKALTPLQKARLAGRNLADPFNLLTIAGEGAFAVGLDSHSPEGPGLRGYANYIGVSFTVDMVGEFFGTFLIPSIAHQDPHYHRMPNASIRRRAMHCITQVVWTEGDKGESMVNYADIAGFAADEEVNNLYVPGLHTNLPSTAARYGLDLATAPIDNFITEFLPDIASHIRVRIVLVQRIINQVAITETTAEP